MMNRTLAVMILALVWIGFAAGPAVAGASRLDAAQIRAEALAYAAVAQAEAGDTAGAMESLALALVNTDDIRSGSDREQALILIAWAQAKTGDPEGALETARGIEGPEQELMTLTKIALVLDGAGNREAAKQVASLGLDMFESEDPWDPESFRLTLGTLLYWVDAKSRGVSSLFERTRTLEHPALRVAAALAAAVVQAESGDVGGAEESLAQARDLLDGLEGTRTWQAVLLVAIWVEAAVGDPVTALDYAERFDTDDDRLAGGVIAAVAQAALGQDATARRILSELEDTAWLGIEMGELTGEQTGDFGNEIPGGALVARVRRDSPAAQAGIEKGDIVLRFGAREVGEPEALDASLAAASPGERPRVQVLRHGRTIDLHVTLASRADELSGSVELVYIRTVIAAAQAQAGDLSGALETLTPVEDEEARAFAIASLASARAAVGDPAGARQVAAAAADSGNLAEHCGIVAQMWFEAGDPSAALATLEQEDCEGAPLPWSIAWGRLLAGDFVGFGQGFIELARSFWIEDESLRPIYAVAWRSASGDVAGALAAIGGISDASDRRFLSAKIDAVGEGPAGEDGAEGEAGKTLDQASAVRNPYLRVLALVDVATAQARAGDAGAAREAAGIAAREATSLRMPVLRALALSAAAKAELAAGDTEAARGSALRSFETGRTVVADHDRARAFVAAAEALAAAGEAAVAGEAADLARASAELLPAEE
jgi:hypothetical protein